MRLVPTMMGLVDRTLVSRLSGPAHLERSTPYRAEKKKRKKTEDIVRDTLLKNHLSQIFEYDRLFGPLRLSTSGSATKIPFTSQFSSLPTSLLGSANIGAHSKGMRSH